ncbi:WNK lysine deficient protein kinase 2 [Ceratobasidium sp. AG-Ba]|nr:WNK lysine deficient protein kinase 2 [Ceratobasidium sp. AG-Ba]
MSTTSADMYSPRRRSSLSDGIHRFTPSKRGQAALDALALGYDVQLPDYSFTLLPRSATSEQALASIISTASSGLDQFPRSTSYREPSHRVPLGSTQGPTEVVEPSSEPSDRRRFARSLQSPHRETVLYSSPNKEATFAPLSARSESPSSVIDSRPSTSSLRSNAPQYVLSSPARDHAPTGPTCQEQLSAALTSLDTPRSLSQSGHVGRQTMSHNRPSPPKLPLEASERRMGTGQKPFVSGDTSYEHQRPRLSYEREISAHTSSKLAAPPHGRFSDRRSKSPTPLRIDTEGLNQRNIDLAFSTRDPRYLQTRSAALPLFPNHSLYDHDDETLAHNRRAFPKASSQYRHSISTAHPSTAYHASTLPTIDEPRFLNAPNADSSAQLRRFSNRSQHSQFSASLRPGSPSVSSASAPSPHRAPAKAYHSFAPSSSGRSASPRTPGTSLPDPDDEDFRVHPERAAISRMESLLMLSACRNEAEGRWPSPGSNGHESVGMGAGPGAGYVNHGMNGFSVGQNHSGMPYPGYNTFAGVPLEFGDRPAQTPFETSRQLGFQAGPGVPNQSRGGGGGGGRSRQRSGSMHVLSPQRNGSRQTSPPRYRQSHVQSPQRQRRQRSMSVAGLSPEAVKKLRVYEAVKGREGNQIDSLGEMIGVGRPVVHRPRSKESKAKKAGRSPPVPEASLSPSEASASISANPLVATQENVPTAQLPHQAPAPPSPADIPLPPSPPVALVLSPAQIPLPPSPDTSSALEISIVSPSLTNDPISVVSPLVSSESFMKYRASRGIESPRPVRTRQNTVAGRTVPTFRLISSPEKADRVVVGPTLDAPATDKSHVQPGGLDAPESLKPDPAIERIITPPPSFWSPPPLSPAVRTSAPLLPAPTTGSSRRTMSVPPPGGEAQADDTRRAWSCEPPVAVDARVGRSFAGDWSQSMIIEVSDEEDEGDMLTDASSSEDESELEEDGVESIDDAPKDLEISKVEERPSDLVETAEREEIARVQGDVVGCIRAAGGASRYYSSKTAPNSSSGSGVNAFEAVQTAIVKLAVDNAGSKQSQQLQNLQAKHMATPPPSAGLAPRQGINPRQQRKSPLDQSLCSQTSQVQASINAYFDPPNTRNFQPTLPVQQPIYPKSNPALDSLRSGLEKRIAASASAVEEAVRARNASPIISKQPVRSVVSHPPSVAALPPRLQRLHGIQTWTSPKLSLAQLEIPPFSRTSSSQPSAHSHLTASPMPSPIVSHQMAAPWPVIPEVPVNNTKPASPVPCPAPSVPSSHPPRSATSGPPVAPLKKGRPAHLQDIAVGSTSVLAPATAPLTRSKKAKHDKRRSADEAASQTKAEPVSLAVESPSKSLVQPATPVIVPTQEPAIPSSPRPSGSTDSPPTKPRSRNRNRNYQKAKRQGVSAKPDPPPVGSDPAPAPAPPTPPAPPSNPVNAVSLSTSVQETTTTANVAKKKKYYKRNKTNKAASTSTGS